MRIAVLIIALSLTMIIGLQSCTIFLGANLVRDEALSGGGAVGLLLAFLFVLGAAFALGLPRASMVIFIVGSFFGFAVGNSTKFADMQVWGGVSLILAIMSYFGSRELRKKKRDLLPPTAVKSL